MQEAHALNEQDISVLAGIFELLASWDFEDRILPSRNAPDNSVASLGVQVIPPIAGGAIDSQSSSS